MARKVIRLVGWKCPECGYLLTKIEMELARGDFPCRCGETKWSDFTTVAEEVEPDRSHLRLVEPPD